MAEHHPLRTADQEPKTAEFASLNAAAERRAKECRSAVMPSLRHLNFRDYDVVYEPSDDTYLLIDAIGYDFDAIEQGEGDDGTGILHSRIQSTLEIGCGTGTPTVYLAKRIRGIRGDEKETSEEETRSTNTNKDCIHYVTDINPDAIRIAKATAESNGISTAHFQAVQCDLASQLLEQLQGKVDVLIFNPPYVPTPDEEVGSSGIEASWAGGINGRVVLDRALPQIARLLAFPHGVAYVVTVDDNYPEQISQTMDELYGMKVIPWLRRRAHNEYLTIQRITPSRAFQDE
jgi:release factor glutamine methyltransferase